MKNLMKLPDLADNDFFDKLINGKEAGLSSEDMQKLLEMWRKERDEDEKILPPNNMAGSY